ncbi:MAG: CsgG/HfaB family protein [Acidobacteriota bacterium]|nr:CsgG/HfaB family protein [Acidobacteriota bacterium]
MRAKSFKIIVCMLFSVLFIIGTQAWGQIEKTVLAVLDLTAENVNASDVRIITSYVEEAVFKTNQFILVERNQIRKLLEEAKYQQSGVCELACVIEIGKQLAAKRVIIGTIGKLGEMFSISLKIIDVELGQTVNIESLRRDCLIEELPDHLGDVVNRLIGAVVTPGQVVPAKRVIEPARRENNVSDLSKARLSTADDQTLLRKYRSKRTWGWAISVPSIAISGLFLIGSIDWMNRDELGLAAENLGGAIATIITTYIGINMIVKGNKGIKTLRAKGLMTRFNLLMNPSRKLYGLDVSIGF